MKDVAKKYERFIISIHSGKVLYIIYGERRESEYEEWAKRFGDLRLSKREFKVDEVATLSLD